MRCKKCSKDFDDSFKYCPYCGVSAKTKRRQNKRANGEGSVYKRADIKSTPWVAMTPSQKIIKNGRIVRQQQIIGHFKTAQEARTALEDYRRNPTTKLNITVEEVYNEWWKVKQRTVGTNQQSVYVQSYKKLLPISQLKFKELRTSQMQQLIDELSDKYSQSLVHKVKVLLGQLYQYAMQNDIVNKNYAEFIVIKKETKSVKECFTDLDIQKLKDSADIVPYADLILIMSYTGHRISEFLNLTHSDVLYDGDMMFLKGGNKTDAGKNKIVPVSPIIRKYVDKWLNKNGETIFCNENGKPFDIKRFRRKIFYPTLESLNLPRLTPHATRRTFSTRLAASGVREDEIVKMMGHTDYSVDIQSYINPEQKTLYDAICKLS